jgi:curli biogenesis system outer membrane secretion channel CsgG
MKKILAVVVAAVAMLASVSLAGTPTTKTYRMTLTYAAKLGANQLPSGEYKVAVNAESVRVTEMKTGNTIEVPAKIETAEKKFEANAITTQTVNGGIEIREIRLGGSTIQLNFR